MQTCFFCDPDAGKEFVYQSYGVRVRIMVETENFCIMPMVGGGVKGYLMIFSKEHYHSVADMPPGHIQELREILDKVKVVLTEKYGPPVIFEHGSTCNNLSCMIDHAHVHVVPAPEGYSALGEIEKEYETEVLQDFSDIANWGSGGIGKAFNVPGIAEMSPAEREKVYEPFVGYIYYEEQDGTGHMHQLETVSGFQPQFLRKAVLTKLGLQEWDWKALVSQKEIDHTLARLCSMEVAE